MNDVILTGLFSSNGLKVGDWVKVTRVRSRDDRLKRSVFPGEVYKLTESHLGPDSTPVLSAGESNGWNGNSIYYVKVDGPVKGVARFLKERGL